MEMKMKPTKEDPKVALKIMERISQKFQKMEKQLSKITKDLK